jgi:hypothetical protein
MANNILEMKKHKMQHRADKPCTCHPNDYPPKPCEHKYALSECMKSAEENVSRFMWLYLSYFLVFFFGLGMGVWLV